MMSQTGSKIVCDVEIFYLQRADLHSSLHQYWMDDAPQDQTLQLQIGVWQATIPDSDKAKSACTMNQWL